MRQREPTDVVFHPISDPDSASWSGEINRIYARSVRRLGGSGMTPRQKAAGQHRRPSAAFRCTGYTLTQEVCTNGETR